MRFVGFRKADFMYIVSDLEDPSKDVTYFDFYVFPLREKWRTSKRMHSSEFLPILKLFVEEGYELLEERPELYERMEKEIVKKRFIPLI